MVLPLPEAGAAMISPGAPVTAASTGAAVGPRAQGVGLQYATGQGAQPVEPAAQAYHVADHAQGRRRDAGRRDILDAATEGGFDDRLARRRRAADNRDGLIRVPQDIVMDVIEAAETDINTENAMRTDIRAGMDPQEAYLKHGKF